MLHTVLAALPLLIAAGAMLARWPAPRAAAVSLAAAILIAVTVFRVPAAQWGAMVLDLAPTLLEVMLILLGGVTLSRLMNASGDTQQVASWVERACQGQPQRAVALMVLGVTPFAESFTGFGLGLVIAIPLLRHLGFNRSKALALGLLGLFLTTWGGLSPGSIIAAHLTGLDLVTVGTATAWFAPPVSLAAAIFAFWVGTGRVRPSALGRSVLVLIPHSVVLIATNTFLGPALGGVLASVTAIVAILLLFRIQYGPIPALDRATLASLQPYAVLAGGLLVVTAISVVVDLGGAAVLTSGALWLAIASGVAGLRLHRSRPGELTRELRASLRTWFPVGLATGGFLVVGAVLTTSGMTTTLGAALASSVLLHALLAPLLGSLSGMVTGSNSGANAMLVATQLDAAQALGAHATSAVAMQHLGSSVGTLLAPSRLALGRAVVGADATDHVPVGHDLPKVAGFVAVSVLWLGIAMQLF